MKQRVQAFTIMELVVAMVLSAIVVSITYTAYNLISRAYVAYHQKHQEMAELIRLDELLRRDFSRAEVIYSTPEGYAFTDSLQAVNYRFTPDYVLRKGALTDTFRVVVSGVQASYEGQPVEESTIEPDSPESGRIDELSFNLLYQKENFPYHYYKHYSSENLINRKAHAFH